MSIDTRARRAADGVHASARGVDPVTQIVDLKREDKTRQRAGIVVTGVVVLALVVGALALTTRWVDSDESAPPASPSVTDQAKQVAAGFLQAYGAYDADRALSFVADGAVTDWGTPEGLRDSLSWNEAAGWTELRTPCQRTGVDGDTVDLRCDYSVHSLGSERIGRGPYGDSYWALHVRDGKILYARPYFPYGSNGFSREMWEPFLAFVNGSYPGDADVMYNEDRSEGKTTPESLRLWTQHIDDYVASVNGS